MKEGLLGTNLLLLLLLLLLLFTAVEFSLGGSSPYTSTDKTNKNILNETIQKHSTNNTKHSQYKYTYCQNTHTLQNKLKQPQYKIYLSAYRDINL